MRNPPPDLFVERFKACVERKGVSLTQVADAVGVHRSVPYIWRDGKGSPEGTSLAALADYFETTMDWLWGRPEPRGAREATGRAVGVIEEEFVAAEAAPAESSRSSEEAEPPRPSRR